MKQMGRWGRGNPPTCWMAGWAVGDGGNRPTYWMGRFALSPAAHATLNSGPPSVSAILSRRKMIDTKALQAVK